MTKLRKNIFLLTCVAYIFYVTNCFVGMVLPANSPYIPFLVLLSCGCCYPMTLIKDKTFLFSLLYALALTFWSLIFHSISGFGYGEGGLDTVMVELAFLLPSISISTILFKEMSEKDIKKVAKWSLASLILSFCFVLPLIIMDNSIVRTVTDADMHDGERLIPGFWNYNMMHMVALLFPVFSALAVFVKSWRRLFFIFLILAVVAIVVQASITTTFVYMLMAFVIVLNFFLYRKRYFIFFVIFELLMVVTAFVFLPTIIEGLLSYYDGTDMYEKIYEFKRILMGAEEDSASVSGRLAFQKQAIDAFMTSPFIGQSFEGGGHSIIYNRLASLGVVGFIPFLLMLIHLVRNTYRHIAPAVQKYYWLFFVGVMVLMLMKNTFGCEGWLMLSVIGPVLFNLVNLPRNVR